jgi:hypothetical protein
MLSSFPDLGYQFELKGLTLRIQLQDGTPFILQPRVSFSHGNWTVVGTLAQY